MSEKKMITEEELKEIAGGTDGWAGLYDGPWKTVMNLQEGYLALRSDAAFAYENEIGKLYNGMQVQVTGNSSGNGYIWVYSPDLYKSGWVNEYYIG